MKNCLIIYIAFLSFLITKAADDEIKKNVIKIFPIHPKPNVTKDCTGFALNENYFITSQICAAQNSQGHTVRIIHEKDDKISGNITPNKRFSVGWNNNIVVGKFSHPLKLIKNVKISKSVRVNPGKNYELIGFADSNKKTEIFNFPVSILSSNVCKNVKFESNKYFKFHKKTQICGKIASSNNLSTLNYGSVLIDKTRKNIIGILSIFTKLQQSKNSLVIFTQLSSYCDYIISETNGSFLCN